MSQTAVELQPTPTAASHRHEARRSAPGAEDNGLVETQPEAHEFSLPPVDHGRAAYFFLAACFVVEALVWGFPFSFGVFQDYYSTHEPFAGSPNIAIIGTCAMVPPSPGIPPYPLSSC